MKIHVVQSGDTLNSIEKIYGVRSSKIASDNDLDLNQSLALGEALAIIDEKEYGDKKDIYVAGYAFPNITAESLYTAVNHLSKLCMFSYHVRPDGTMIDILPFTTEKIIEEAHLHKSMVITNIGEDGDYCAELCRILLKNDDAIEHLIENILKELKANSYKSIDINFEYIYPRDKNKFSLFIEKIASAVHKEGYLVSCTLPPKMSEESGGAFFGGYDYAFIGKTVDNICMMTYNWGNTFSPPGPISPIDDVEKSIKYALNYIPKEKLFLGIQNYGYDWSTDYSEISSARKIENNGALGLARYYNAEIKFDEKSQSPYFTYVNTFGFDRVVWFEDARSINAKYNLVLKYDIPGISLWTVTKPAKLNWILADIMFDIIK